MKTAQETKICPVDCPYGSSRENCTLGPETAAQCKSPLSCAYHKQTNSDTHLALVGLAIADLFRLHQDKDGRYNTAWGTKTPLGLYLSVKRVIEEERVNL